MRGDLSEDDRRFYMVTVSSSACRRRDLLPALACLFAPLALGGAGPGAPVVTVLGDSITAGLGLPASDALPVQLQAALARRGVRAIVRGAGVSGDTTAGGLARLDFSVQPDTAVCVVELGANDFLQSVDLTVTERDLRSILRRLKARRIAPVLAGARLPGRAVGGYGRAFEAMFARVAQDEGAALAPDLLAGVEDRPEMKQRDGLHPNAAGVRIIAARLAPLVARTLARPRS